MLSGCNTHIILTEYGCSQNRSDTPLPRVLGERSKDGYVYPAFFLRVAIPRLSMIPDYTSRGDSFAGRTEVLACLTPGEAPLGKMLGRGSSRKTLEDGRHFKRIHFMVGKPVQKEMATNNTQSEAVPEDTPPVPHPNTREQSVPLRLLCAQPFT